MMKAQNVCFRSLFQNLYWSLEWVWIRLSLLSYACYRNSVFLLCPILLHYADCQGPQPLIQHLTNWRAWCKKGVYWILADFHFLQDRANFWETDLFWHGKHRSVIVSDDLRFVLQNNVCKKTRLSSGDLLFNEKQKKPFVSLSVISHTITVICYFCFVGASDWGAVRD